MDEMTDLYFDLMHKTDDDIMKIDIERQKNAKKHIEREELILSKLIFILKQQIELKETIEEMMKDMIEHLNREDKKEQNKYLKVLTKNIKELKIELNRREEEYENKIKTINEIEEYIEELEEEREEHKEDVKNRGMLYL